MLRIFPKSGFTPPPYDRDIVSTPHFRPGGKFFFSPLLGAYFQYRETLFLFLHPMSPPLSVRRILWAWYWCPELEGRYCGLAPSVLIKSVLFFFPCTVTFSKVRSQTFFPRSILFLLQVRLPSFIAEYVGVPLTWGKAAVTFSSQVATFIFFFSEHPGLVFPTILDVSGPF